MAPGPELPQAPTGTVTLVFTDVQGSTSLWERAAEAMRQALAVHNRVLRDGLRALGGYEVKTEGDAFMAAFADPLVAVRWCIECQEALVLADWPAEILAMSDACEVAAERGGHLFRGLRVRMGAHVGRPDCLVDPTTGRMDYFGRMVNRVARVGGAGHGGQILVSGPLWQDVSRSLGELGAPVVLDLGEHRLKGLKGSERLVQLLPGALAERAFAPLKTLDATRTNLVPHPASFVGREAELAELGRMADEGARLITLLGPGGIGKTRLSRCFSAMRLEDFTGPDGGGAWFVDLSAARRADELCALVGRSLGIPSAQSLSAEEVSDQLGRAIDGIPLAIELAAARANILSPVQLRDRLTRRLDLLAGGKRGRPARQATLRGAIEWSWHLLEPWEQSALAQCAVFASGWDLEAAEAVVRLDDHPEAPDVLEVLAALKDKSLLRLVEDPGGAAQRLGMYLSIQEYAQECLEASGQEAAVRERHHDYYVKLVGTPTRWYGAETGRATSPWPRHPAPLRSWTNGCDGGSGPSSGTSGRSQRPVRTNFSARAFRRNGHGS